MNKAADDFKIDFEKKKISYIGKNGAKYSANELYSFLEDVFDEVKNMKHDIPIVANGWTVGGKEIKGLVKTGLDKMYI